jgi:DNA-binding NarL/FixJ family response regulator
VPRSSVTHLGRGGNAAIAGRLKVSEGTVEAARAALFRKLDVEMDRDSNRLVLAVLSLLHG